MGNVLEKEVFENSFYEGYDLNDCEVYVVDDTLKASSAVERIKNFITIYVDCEGHYFGNEQQERVGLVQIATTSTMCFLFDVITCEDILDVLKDLLEAPYPKKVFHDCTGDVSVLLKSGIDLTHQLIDDTQEAYKYLQKRKLGHYDDSNPGLSLEDLYCRLFSKPFPKVNTKKSASGHNKWICTRPMSESMIKYAALDVLMLDKIHTELRERMPFYMMPEYQAAVKKRQMQKLGKNKHRPNSGTVSTITPRSMATVQQAEQLSVGEIAAGVATAASAVKMVADAFANSQEGPSRSGGGVNRRSNATNSTARDIAYIAGGIGALAAGVAIAAEVISHVSSLANEDSKKSKDKAYKY